jgi:hypothetical protein
VQVDLRQPEVFLKHAGMINDAEDLARWAMIAHPASAGRTVAAGEVNISHNTASHKPLAVSLDDCAGEFMAGDAFKAVITLQKLYVRTANASQIQSNQRIAAGAFGTPDVPYFNLSIVEVNTCHSCFNVPFTKPATHCATISFKEKKR